MVFSGLVVTWFSTVAVLPKFEVTVDAPSYFYYLDSVLTINVGAKLVAFCLL